MAASQPTEVAITVENVSKSFKLPHEKQSSLKGMFVNIFRGGNRSYETQVALKDVSFQIYKGEFFGIVGRNGSGKSTLLKLLAGIYTPSKGRIDVRGKLTPFIELGVGFNPELTGRENVFLNGALLGFSHKEMQEMYDDIVDFAELGKFMDQKLKNYSSGMQVRLAFSIAIRARSDILLIDEVLAVGDTAFQRKCFEHFVNLKQSGITVILVTHDMSAVERFCDRALVIHDSTTRGVLKPIDATTVYNKLNAEADEPADSPEAAGRWGTGKVKMKRVRVAGQKGRHAQAVAGEELALEIELAGSDEEVVVGLAFIDQYGVNVSGPNSKGVKIRGNGMVSFKVPKLPLVRGRYDVTVAVFDKNVVEEFDHHERALTLEVTSQHERYGKVDLFGSWKQHGGTHEKR